MKIIRNIVISNIEPENKEVGWIQILPDGSFEYKFWLDGDWFQINFGEKGKPGTTIYSELEDKPSINNITLEGNKTLEELGIQEKGDYVTEIELSQNLDKKANKEDIPDVSSFITNTVNNLTNYYTKLETYTQSEVNNLIGSITTLNFKVVDILPEIGESNLIYLVPSTQKSIQNIKDEYIWIDNNWEPIGSTQVDLSNYYDKNESDSKFALKNELTSIDFSFIQNKPTTLEGYGITDAATKDELSGYLPLKGGRMSDGFRIDRSLTNVLGFSVTEQGGYMALEHGGLTNLLYITSSGPVYQDSSSKNYTIWHEGNFNPDNCIQNKGWDQSLDSTAIGTGFQRLSEGSETVGPFLSFGYPGYICQLTTGYTDYEGYSNKLKFRVRDGDTGNFGPWKTIWHSGNLTPATSSAEGLMSASDKAKLDGLASALSLTEDQPTAVTLDLESESDATKNTEESLDSINNKLQSIRLLTKAIETFARNHPEYTEFYEWLNFIDSNK